jgi:hypothetical protein
MAKLRINNGAKIEQKCPTHTLAYRLFKRGLKKRGRGRGRGRGVAQKLGLFINAL